MEEKFDLIVVGTGFASTFFLKSYLEKAAGKERILVLERGSRNTHSWQVENRKNSPIKYRNLFVRRSGHKDWMFNVGFGGGSNCWWAGTPRFMPNDFRLKSAYGIGVDWPITYDDLEPHYCEVEKIMSISGPDDGSPYPRSRPYPQPPHRFSEPDKLLKSAYPKDFYQQPTARARIATKNRPSCCASGVCHRCPIDAKFTIQSEMSDVFKDPRVHLKLEAEVETIDTQGNIVNAVNYTIVGGKAETARADLIVLGTNALFNPYILLKSGFDHPLLGKYLHEQIGVPVKIDLNGVDNFQGSTSVTGLFYLLYDGAHRSEYSACLIETTNIPELRLDPGKWRQRLNLLFIFEDIPSTKNYVKISENALNKPEAVYTGHSHYTQKAIDRLPEVIPDVMSPLPIENIEIGEKRSTEAHIQGTTVMGNDPKLSIVDRHLVHHKYRNLLLLGSGVFPSCSPANPTLTLSALSLWAAAHLTSSS